MRKRYIIFDFDGTLANTNDVIVDSWHDTLNHYLGHSLDRRTIEASFGEILMVTVQKLIPDADPIEVRDHYRKYQSEHCHETVRLFDGVRELLDELKKRGCMIGVATSRTTDSLFQYLKDLRVDSYIDAAVTMEDVTRHKPYPDTLISVLEKLGADPAESIMIGDTKFDVGCANNAGVDSVLVEWSHYIDEEDMAAEGFAPTYRIDTPAELLDII